MEGTGWRGRGSLGCKGRKAHWVLGGVEGERLRRWCTANRGTRGPPLSDPQRQSHASAEAGPEESESHPSFSSTQGASGPDAVKTMSGMRLRSLMVTLMCLPLLRVTVP